MSTVANNKPRVALGRKAMSLMLAALTAWAVVTAWDVVSPLATAALTTPAALADENLVPSMVRTVFLYALFGIPPALIACFALGMPAWALADHRNLRKRSDAIWFGTCVGLIVFFCDVAFTVLFGLSAALDPDTYSSSSDSVGKITDDGLPTAYGWLLKSIGLPKDALAGAVAGWVVWSTSGYRK